MQHQNRNWHLHSASPCPVFCGFFSLAILSVCIHSSLGLHNLRQCLRALELVQGEGQACHDCLLLRASFSCPNSLDPWAVFNYPICAVLTVGSRTQLWEANQRADLEKECLHSKGPWGFKGHYIGERLAGLKALAISLPSAPAVFVQHELLFWNVCRNTDTSLRM